MVGKFAQGTVLTCCEKYQNTSDDICIFIDKESITESLTWYSWAASPDGDESINHWITYLRFMGQLGQMVKNQSITESLNWYSRDSWPRWWVINQSLSLLPEIHGAAGPDGEESINHWVSYLRFMGKLAQMVRNQSITESLTWDLWGSWPRWWGINQSLHLLP